MVPFTAVRVSSMNIQPLRFTGSRYVREWDVKPLFLRVTRNGQGLFSRKSTSGMLASVYSSVTTVGTRVQILTPVHSPSSTQTVFTLSISRSAAAARLATTEITFSSSCGAGCSLPRQRIRKPQQPSPSLNLLRFLVSSRSYHYAIIISQLRL